MTIDHVLAVVAVSDFDISHDWYRRLVDTPAPNVPMRSVIDPDNNTLTFIGNIREQY
jgi:hypothetical protein